MFAGRKNAQQFSVPRVMSLESHCRPNHCTRHWLWTKLGCLLFDSFNTMIVFSQACCVTRQGLIDLVIAATGRVTVGSSCQSGTNCTELSTDLCPFPPLPLPRPVLHTVTVDTLPHRRYTECRGQPWVILPSLVIVPNIG